MKDCGLFLNMELQSDPRMLCVVRGAIEHLTENYGFAPPECRAITRAVDEALANVMRHAYCNQPDQLIQISCRVVERMVKEERKKALEIVMEDSGVVFEPEKVKERSLDEVKPGGLGLHFIRDSMDIMEHQRVGEKNRLRLVKYLTSETSVQACQGE